MAAGTFAWSGPGILAAFNKELDFNDGATKGMFSSSAYTFDPDTHGYKSSVTNEVTGTNWAAGGVVLANCVASVVSATNRVKFVCDDVSVANVTATGFRVFTIYNNTAGTDATRAVMGAVTFDSDMSPNAGTQTVDVDNTNGFGYIGY